MGGRLVMTNGPKGPSPKLVGGLTQGAPRQPGGGRRRATGSRPPATTPARVGTAARPALLVPQQGVGEVGEPWEDGLPDQGGAEWVQSRRRGRRRPPGSS